MSYEVDKAIQKLHTGWENANDLQRAELMGILHDLGLSLANMRMLLDIGPGQMKYAWWKLVKKGA